MSFRENYLSIFVENGLSRFATETLAARFETLFALLTETNEKMNLTAITEEREVIFKHFADCLISEEDIPQGARLLDVGCGGGFPTLPLALARPDLSVTALDSTAKKLTFVSDCAEKLNLNVKTLAARAEEAGKMPLYREKFDAVTARAVASLPVLAEWCLPFVKVGGVFLAMKGPGGKEELEQAKNAVQVLGGKIEKANEFSLCGAVRCNILIRKTAPTPPAYPRNNGAIKKKPL